MFRAILVLLVMSVAVWAQTAENTAKTATSTSATNGASTEAANPLAGARALMKQHRYEDAAAAFRAIVEKEPSAEEAHVGLMRSLVRARRVDEAEAAGKAATTALANSATVHAAFGDVHFRAGRFAEAEAEYRSSLKLDGNSARGWFGLARMYEMISMHKHAKDAYARAHELAPEDEQIFEYWTDALPYAERLQIYKKHVGEHPTEDESNVMKSLTAAAERKPWVLTSELKPAEIKMPSIGRHLAGVYDINRDGPMNISTGFGLQVRFNDRVSADLLLDTGAGGITIGNKLAEKIGVVKIADAAIGGIGDQGPVRSYVGWVDKIAIGSVAFKDCIVTVSSRSDVGDETGLIGADVFRKFLVTLDFSQKKLLLKPLPKNPAATDEDSPQDRYIAPEMQSFTKFYRFGHDIVVPVVVSDKAVGNFILDTGAFANTISTKLASQVTKASADGDFVIKGVSGKVDNVLTGKKVILQIAGMRIESHDLPVLSYDRISANEGTEIAGFIGIRTLVQMKMTIDYRDGLVNLEVYNFQKARE